MNKMLLPAAVLAALLAGPLLAHEDDAAAGGGQSQFGKVNFPTSCSAAVQPQFERAVAMLHSFFFPEHIKAFQAVTKADPGCAMAYWGLAISQRGNPLVPPWPEENLKRALEAIQQGKALAKTERERDWLNALEVVYKDYDKAPVSERSKRYERAMEELARKYPDDKEASIFYALALLEAVDHADKTYARQLKAGGILEPIDREQPAHPGLAHYIIHTYDFEPLAEDREARRVIDELRAVTKLSGARSYGADTGRLAPASRYVLERAAWAEAANLAVPPDLYTYAEAIPRFTRALGAAKTGNPAMAKEEIERLQALSKSAENSYWGEQIQVLVLAASAWRAHAENRKDDALKFMRAAADLEDSTEKHVSMENRLYPMREML